jgi:hypothetical protein
MSRPRYEEPFHWWGATFDSPAGRDVAALLRDTTLDCATAAVLWAALARRSSLAVIAGPSRAGKTTVLSALLDFLPAETRRLYLRGSYESFAFLSDASIVPHESAILINEISPHLPIYLWGPAVARALRASERGFSLLATAHADSIQEFVRLLTGSPLRVQPQLVAAFEFVLVLEPSSESASGRRVREVHRLTRTRSGIAFSSMPADPRCSAGAARFAVAGKQSWFPADELRERARILDDLRQGRIDALPEGAVPP